MKFFDFLRRNEVKKLLPFLLVGVLLFIAAGVLGDRSESEERDLSLTAAYSKELEERVEEICRTVDGVGDCRVMITLSGKIKRTYSGERLVYEEPPAVIGVTVVCDGGRRASVKSDLTELLTALFDIGANDISILPAK